MRRLTVKNSAKGVGWRAALLCVLALVLEAGISGCAKKQVYIPPEWRKPLPQASAPSSAGMEKPQAKPKDVEQKSAPIIKSSPKFEERDISAPPAAPEPKISYSPAPVSPAAESPAKSSASHAKTPSASAPASSTAASTSAAPAPSAPPQPSASQQPSSQPAASPAAAIPPAASPAAASGTKSKATETPVPAPPKAAKAKVPEGPQRQASMHLVNTAKSSMAQGNPDQAIPLLEQAIQVDVYNGDAFFELARAWKMKGSPKRALEFARKAEVLYQDDLQKLKQVLLFEAEAYKESGDSEKAKSYRQKAQKL
jgi:hypothetical protein